MNQMPTSNPLVNQVMGRAKLVEEIEDAVVGGRTVLLLGPFGIGKTSILMEISRRLGESGIPCGFAPDTQCFSNVADALLAAHPGAGDSAPTRRELRSRLRLAVDRKPSVLLLDHVTSAGSAMKGFLKSLRGTGLGVAMAVDAENRRDRLAARALHLSYLEIVVPALTGQVKASLFDHLLAEREIPRTLHDDDRRRLLRLSKGNPGRVVMFCDLLVEPRFWRDDRVLTSSVEMAAKESILHHYLALRDDLPPAPRGRR